MQTAKTVVNWDKCPRSVEKITDLILDFSFYPRKEVDYIIVDNYAKAMQSGAIFPPVRIGVFKGEKIVVDGFHRINARKQLNIEYVDCTTAHFDSEAALFAEAVRCNSGHGKSFTQLEIQANIKRLKKYKFDVTEIETIVHIPATDITNEFSKPILTVTLPNGTKKSCTQIKPGEHGVDGIICLKNALFIVCRWAEAGKIPNEPFIAQLTERTKEALSKTRFDNNHGQEPAC